jgi:hypothetical protein
MRNYPGFAGLTAKAYRHELHLAAPRGIGQITWSCRHDTEP